MGLAVMIATWLAIESRAQAPEKSALAGLWVRNRDASDPPPERGGGAARGRSDRGRGGRMGRGGFSGGGFGRGGGGRMAVDPDEVARMRDALRDIMEPPDHLTITQTDSMIVITGPDGRTTRLAPDGSKVKDENTKVERRTRWEGGKLISEISGAGPGKITQTFSVDADTRRLRIVAQVEGGRSGQARTITEIYDVDER